MDYKELFHTVVDLLRNPAKEWERLKSLPYVKVQMGFVYPLLTLAGLLTLIGLLIANGWGGPMSFQYAMIGCIGVAVSFFATFFITAYFGNILLVKYAKQENNLLKAQAFSGYAMVVPLVISIVQGIIPNLDLIFFLLNFYTIYIVWEGLGQFYSIKEEHKMLTLVVFSAMILLLPLILNNVFKKMTI